MFNIQYIVARINGEIFKIFRIYINKMFYKNVIYLILQFQFKIFNFTI